MTRQLWNNIDNRFLKFNINNNFMGSVNISIIVFAHSFFIFLLLESADALI